MSWLLRREWAAPLAVLVLVFALLLRLDQQQRAELRSERRDVALEAQRRAAELSTVISGTVNSRIGALRTAKLQLTQVSDSISEETFFMALDSVTRDLTGLSAISVVRPDGTIQRGNGGWIGRRGVNLEVDTVVMAPFRRAMATKLPTASGVVDLPVGRRVFVFDPVVSSDSASVKAMVVGELEPTSVLRAALASRGDDPVGLFAVFAANGVPINTSGRLPPGWPTIVQPVPVADTNWTLRWAYEPAPALRLPVPRPNRSANRPHDSSTNKPPCFVPGLRARSGWTIPPPCRTEWTGHHSSQPPTSVWQP